MHSSAVDSSDTSRRVRVTDGQPRIKEKGRSTTRQIKSSLGGRICDPIGAVIMRTRTRIEAGASTVSQYRGGRCSRGSPRNRRRTGVAEVHRVGGARHRGEVRAAKLKPKCVGYGIRADREAVGFASQ